MQKFKLIIPFLIAVTILVNAVTGCTRPPLPEPPAAVPIPAVGEQLPEIILPAPANPATRIRLGLKNEKAEIFTVQEIDCDILLVEIFSMYCPFCQREAPNINRLYNLIQADRELAEKIKLIGIGVGNSTFEVGVFKKRYNVEFPLFTDSDFTVHNQLGQVRTPYFFAIRNRGELKNRILISKLGSLSDPQKFLQTLSHLLE